MATGLRMEIAVSDSKGRIKRLVAKTATQATQVAGQGAAAAKEYRDSGKLDGHLAAGQDVIGKIRDRVKPKPQG